jgi:hypothetical protein
LSEIVWLRHASWAGPVAHDELTSAGIRLEHGNVLFFPELSFSVDASELSLFSAGVLGRAKNISFDPATGRISNTSLEGEHLAQLRRLMTRFSDAAWSLIRVLLPRYSSHLSRGRSSFRPAEIAGRASSWRKDDTKLHVDSFPASPVQGRRILRVFTNVNPEGRARTWRVGGDFDTLADRFASSLSVPMPIVSLMLQAARITKSRRSPYDALMLQLHDRMKQDASYQENAAQTRFDFPAGSTWIAFTDQVSHAAMAGQFQLEQTFVVDVEALAEPDLAPVRVLERLKGRRLT